MRTACFLAYLMTQPFTVNFTQARFVGERVCSGVHERSGVSGIMVEVVEDKHSRNVRHSRCCSVGTNSIEEIYFRDIT